MIPREVFAHTLQQFFAPIGSLLSDPDVSEIMVNGWRSVYVEKQGRVVATDACFGGAQELLAALRNAAQFVGKRLDEQCPILEGWLPDGSRLQAVIPPAAPEGPYVSIRRFPATHLSLVRLTELGSLSHTAAETLTALVEAKLNVIIAGGAGSGKTSLLAALATCVPVDERIILIEDCREVRLPGRHVVTLEARPPDARGHGAVRVRELFNATLRMRPDRIILGEIRGAEALDIIQAMTSGHGGCMATLHATSPRDALSRLETLCLMSDIEMPLAAVRAQIGSAVDLVVQVSRLRDGSRRVTHVTQLRYFDPSADQYSVQHLFLRDAQRRTPAGPTVGGLVPTGQLPDCEGRLRESGIPLPDALYRAARTARGPQ